VVVYTPMYKSADMVARWGGSTNSIRVPGDEINRRFQQIGPSLSAGRNQGGVAKKRGASLVLRIKRAVYTFVHYSH